MSRRRLRAGSALALLTLCACATPKAPPAPVQAPQAAAAPATSGAGREVVVKVPVAVKSPCVPRSLPPPPKYPDSAEALREAGGAADRYQLLAAGRILRARRLAVLEKVVEACR